MAEATFDFHKTKLAYSCQAHFSYILENQDIEKSPESNIPSTKLSYTSLENPERRLSQVLALKQLKLQKINDYMSGLFSFEESDLCDTVHNSNTPEEKKVSSIEDFLNEPSESPELEHNPEGLDVSYEIYRIKNREKLALMKEDNFYSEDSF